MIVNDDDWDDLWWRFMAANGVTRMEWVEHPDGCGQVLRAFRADGSELDWTKAYGANAQLTPYTPTKGSA